MYVIGLTGNIATGKSTVARLLAEKGAHVIDADALAHRALHVPEIRERVIQRFGDGILGPDGEIDRRALGRIVFANPQALADLEALVHPWVIQEIRECVARCPACVIVIEAIKLLETDLRLLCDEVWVVTAPYEQQVARLVSQRGMTPEEAEARIAAQPPQEQKVRLADVVIANEQTLDALRERVNKAWASIKAAMIRRQQEGDIC